MERIPACSGDDLEDILEAILGAAAGSPYIVFISTTGMLCSSDIYIYIICVPTRNRNNEFIL